MNKTLSTLLISILVMVAGFAAYMWYSKHQENNLLKEQAIETLTTVNRQAQDIIRGHKKALQESEKREKLLIKEFEDAIAEYEKSKKVDTKILKHYEEVRDAVIDGDMDTIDSILAGER